MSLDTTELIQLFNTYGYFALAALLLLAAAGVPLPLPITTTFIVLGALTTHPGGPSFLAQLVLALEDGDGDGAMPQGKRHAQAADATANDHGVKPTLA